MKNYQVFIIGVLAAFIAVSCCPCRSIKAPQSKSIVNVRWEAVEIQGTPVNANGNYFLEFSETETMFNGRGDCNSIGGMYTSPAEGKINMSGIRSTMMFCPNQDMENKFMAMLETVDSFQIDGNMMMMYSKNERVAVFKAVNKAQ